LLRRTPPLSGGPRGTCFGALLTIRCGGMACRTLDRLPITAAKVVAPLVPRWSHQYGCAP
jgi:hypothetical protein